MKEFKWLKERAGYLSIYKIENELNMPGGTLRKYISGQRNLNEQWHNAVITWVKAFRK